MDPDRSRWLEPAGRSLAESLREEARHAPGGEVVETGGLLLCRGPGRLPMNPNAAMCLDSSVPAPRALADMAAFYRERGSGFMLQLALEVEQGEQGEQDELAAAATVLEPLAAIDAAALVLDHPIEPPGPDADLAWVVDTEGVEAYAAVADDAFQSLGWPAGEAAKVFIDPALLLHPSKAAVVARIDGVPAAVAYVQLAAGMGLVSWVGTVAAARGRGLAEAVTRATVARAFAMGADAVWLVASPMGEPLYRQLGFCDLARSRSFALWPGLSELKKRAEERDRDGGGDRSGPSRPGGSATR